MHRLLPLLVALPLSGCAALAVASAPPKASRPPSAQGQAAAERFWSTLHQGRYQDLPEVIEEHMRVLVREPEDVLTVAHLGFLHAWTVAEAARRPPAASVVGHLGLARRFFEEAVTLDRSDPRFLGFLASFTMAEGSVLRNERELRTGYYLMKDAVAAWPEFNLFTSGYTVSTGPVTEAPFREGLEQQWETLDRCFGERVSRRAPDLRRYLALETREGPRRACWNSWIAPHNWEGFFLNFGDMLVRAGDLENAGAMYRAAALSPTWSQWPYRAVLERRLAALPTLPARLARGAAPGSAEPEWAPMFNTAFACMACHQETGEPPVAVAR